VKGKIDAQIAEMGTQAAQVAGTPAEGMMKSVLDVMKSIQVTSEGKKGSLRGELDPSVLLPALMGTAMTSTREFAEPAEEP